MLTLMARTARMYIALFCYRGSLCPDFSRFWFCLIVWTSITALTGHYSVCVSHLFLNLGKNLDAVHDITVAYPHNIPQTERHLLYGDFPKEIHFHVHRYPVDALPTSREGLQLWCHRRWEEKEERLRSFYQGEKNFHFTGQTVIPPCKSELRVSVVRLLSVLYWTLFSPAMCLLIYLYSLVRWYFIITIVVFVLQERIFGGLEIIELACYRFLHKQPHSNVKKNEWAPRVTTQGYFGEVSSLCKWRCIFAWLSNISTTTIIC